MNKKFISVMLVFALIVGILPLNIGSVYADIVWDQDISVDILNENPTEFINKVQLEAVVKDENGNVIEEGDEVGTTTATMQVQLSDIAIAWESLTPDVATVDNDGEVTRVAESGEATIKASLVSDASIFDEITVVIADNVEDMDAEFELVMSEMADASTFDYQDALCYNIMRTSDDDIAMIADKLDTSSEPSSASSYSKFIIGLVAAHEDPRNYNEKDYVADLEAMIGETGNFGSSYTTSAARAMLALDMVGSNYDKAKVINYLLSMQDETSGAFELSSSRGVDLSATGLILSALSRHYGETIEGVTGLDAAVDAAVANLKDVETESAGFVSMGGENISALETAVTALMGNDVDPLTEADWIKDGTTVYHKLLSFKGDDVYGSNDTRAFAILTALKNAESVYTLIDLKDKNLYIQNANPSELINKVQLEAVVKDMEGNALEGETMVWESLDTSKATVDSDGLVTRKSGADSGDVYIKVALNDDSSVFDYVKLEIADNVEDVDAEFELVMSELADASTFDYQDALCYNIMSTSDEDIAMIADKLDTSSEPSSASSYSKFIIGLVAAHEDPRDYNEKDYVAELEALIGETGNFGSSYTTSAARAMLALDMVGSDYDKAKVINYLLSMQDDTSGGFELSSSRGVDLSATGLILSALSRYYGETIEGVTGLDAAVDAAVANLKDVETESAGFVSMGGENISALETAVTALRGNSVDPLTEEDWIKDGTTVYHKLLSFKGDDVYGSNDTRAFATLTALKNTESVYTMIDLKDKNLYIQNANNGDLTNLLQLEAVLKDKTGNVLADEALVWESLTTEKAAVDENGLVESASDTGTSIIKVSLTSDATVFDVIQLINGEPDAEETLPVDEEEGMEIEIAIVGKQMSETDTAIRYEVIFGPQTVTLDDDTKYGYTALGALDATGLSYTANSSGMVKSISGIENEGIGGWKYEKNEQAPGVLAINNSVEENDKVMWYYCEEGMSGTAPDWPRNGSYATIEKDASDLDELTEEEINSLADASKSLEERTTLAKEFIQELEGTSDEQKLEQVKTIADTLLGSISHVVPEITTLEGKTVVKIESEELSQQISDVSASLETLEAAINEVGIESLDELEIKKEVAIEIEESLTNMYLSIPREAMQTLTDKGLDLVIKTSDMELRMPPSLLNLDSAVGSDIKLTAGKVADSQKVNEALDNSGMKGMLPLSPVYDFNLYGDASGAQTSIHGFDKEITIELTLSDLDLENLNTDQLGVYYLNETTNQWEYVGGTVAKESQSIVFKTNHFSLYTVMEHKQTFDDIQNHWAKQYIETMASKGICNGVNATTFAPDRSITRAEFATLVCKTLDLETASYAGSFKDIQADDWYGGFVQACVDQNLFSGYNGMFRPNDVITREEMACVIVKALEHCEKAFDSQTDASFSKFSDSESVSSWAQTSIEKVLSLQIMSGMSDVEFAPKATATRAQAVVVLNKMIND